MADYMKADIDEAFEKLSDVEKLQYFTLHSGHGQSPAHWPSQIHPSVPARDRQRIAEQHAARTGGEATLISIFQTNCMEMGPGAAVFLHTSRFNHSCVPNACFSWNEAIGKETIHTMRDVEEGEEIVISYVDMEHDKRLRAWELRHYGFVCGCEACGDEEDVSPSLRSRLAPTSLHLLANGSRNRAMRTRARRGDFRSRSWSARRWCCEATG